MSEVIRLAFFFILCVYLQRKCRFAEILVPIVSHNLLSWLQEDLSLPNHLVGLKQPYLKLCFLNVHDLMYVKSKIFPRIRKNQQQVGYFIATLLHIRSLIFAHFYFFKSLFGETIQQLGVVNSYGYLLTFSS